MSKPAKTKGQAPASIPEPIYEDGKIVGEVAIEGDAQEGRTDGK